MSGLKASNGTVTILSPTVNGPIEGEADFEFSYGGSSTAIMRSNIGTSGFTEKPTAGSITITAWHTAGVSIEALNNIRNAQIIVELNIGQVFSMSNASRTGDPITVSTNDGNFALSFSGDPWREIS